MKQHQRIVDISGHLSIIAILKMLKEIEAEKLYGSTHHITKIGKQILVNCPSSL